MTPCIILALQKRDRIAEILCEQTGKTVSADWSPFNPLCAACGRIDQARVTGFSASEQTVSYECVCGSAGRVSMVGGGKLVWRIDWAARWSVLGVTVEPFGKDHASRGGSYDTGTRISHEVFEHEPPFPIPYEWIRLKGRGDMSSSKGNVLSIDRMLDVVPPEALRYLVIRERPQRSIGFDPGLPLLQLVDQVDDAAAQGRDERALELSRAGEFQPVGVPFKHGQLPMTTSWIEDGGPTITLPLVYTEDPGGGPPNLGIYRMQRYSDTTCGMHWQIGKGGGFHHASAERDGRDLPVTVFLGGPPAALVGALAPLPENVPELLLASLVHGARIRRVRHPDAPHPLLAEAEWCLAGRVPAGERQPEADGQRVELRGFGVFSVKTRDAHMGRNPRTGEAVDVSKKSVPFFKVGKELRNRLNDKT